MILNDDRVRTAIETVARNELEESGERKNFTFASLVAKHTTRANHLLNTMKTAISTSLIRFVFLYFVYYNL